MSAQADPPRPTLDQVNRLDEAAFTALLGGVYEHSPWVARRAWPQRPFPTLAALQAALARVLDQASAEEQMALMRAHPELSGKARMRHDLTADSRQEQAGAGLDQCSPEEFERLQEGNRAYAASFGFPFIIAVKGLGRRDIIEALQRRAGRSREEEIAEALAQIQRIAALRLRQKIAD
jgi:2-oxo-4-hydroxy-4-carboxy-5-ureidoimidazoline decarboxylase